MRTSKLECLSPVDLYSQVSIFKLHKCSNFQKQVKHFGLLVQISLIFTNSLIAIMVPEWRILGAQLGLLLAQNVGLEWKCSAVFGGVDIHQSGHLSKQSFIKGDIRQSGHSLTVNKLVPSSNHKNWLKFTHIFVYELWCPLVGLIL